MASNLPTYTTLLFWMMIAVTLSAAFFTWAIVWRHDRVEVYSVSLVAEPDLERSAQAVILEEWQGYDEQRAVALASLHRRGQRLPGRGE